MFKHLEPIDMTKKDYYKMPTVAEMKNIGDQQRMESDRFDAEEKGFGALVEVIKTNIDTKSEDDILEIQIGVRKVNFI